MANIKHVNSVVDREFRNKINQLIDSINAQGKSIQDLVAEGQLTPEQYATFMKEFNGLIKKGELTPDDLSPELLEIINNSDGTPLEVLSIPRDDSVTTKKITDETIEVLKEKSFSKIHEIDNDLKVIFNTLGDTNSHEYMLKHMKNNTAYNFSEDDTFIEIYGKKPRIMETTFNVVSGANAAAITITSAKPNTTYYSSIWYKVSDLESLLQGGYYFNPYFLARNASNSSLGGAGNSSNTPGLSINDLRTVGSVIHSEYSTESIKTEVAAIQSGWVNINIEFSSGKAGLDNIRLDHTRVAAFSLNEIKTLRMTTPVITTKRLNPYVFPFADIEEFNKYKETLKPELIPAIELMAKEKEMEEESKKTFNLLGDVNDSAFLSSQDTALANVKFASDSVPNTLGKTNRVMEISFDVNSGTGNSFVSTNYDVSPNKTYFFGAWYKLDELEDLLGNDNIFAPYVVMYSSDGSTLGDISTSIGLNSDDIKKEGHRIALYPNVNTLEVVEIQNGWVYIRTTLKITNPEATTVKHYYTRIPSSVLSSQKKLKMSMPILTDKQINPYLNPYASEEEFKNSVVSSENIQMLNSRVSELEKADINSKWFGKELTVFGDSNSQNSGVTVWHQFLQSQLNLNVNNFARGGAGYIARSTNGITPNIPVQIEQASGNPDLIIIFSGGNDYALKYPLGTFGDTTMDTLYGALDISFKEVINKYPLSTICVFTQTRRASEGKNTAGVSVEDQVNAQIEVAGKYSLPVLNLYHAGNVHPWNTTYRENRIPDGVHLSTEGHRVLASKVKAFIETL